MSGRDHGRRQVRVGKVLLDEGMDAQQQGPPLRLRCQRGVLIDPFGNGRRNHIKHHRREPGGAGGRKGVQIHGNPA
jgi:hypothetical protein